MKMIRTVLGIAATAVIINTASGQSSIIVPSTQAYTNDANTLLLDHFDGTTTGSPNGAVTYANGVFGHGVHLDSGAWVSWNLGALAQGTVEFWGNLDTTASSGGIWPKFIWCGFSQFYAATFELAIVSNTPCSSYHIGFILPENWIVTGWLPSPVISAHSWHHYATSWGGKGFHFYVDGTLIYSNSATYGQNTSTGWWCIGGRNATGPAYPGNVFSGVIDELRISNIQREFTSGTPPATPPRTAAGMAEVVNGFLVGITLQDSGAGYTNTPLVRLIGGGGSGAHAVAVVSNGVVTSVNVVDAGYGYTNAPAVVIEPPFIPNPVLSVAPMTLLSFSNLTVGASYQLQRHVDWYWDNTLSGWSAAGTVHTEMVGGVASSEDYRLALSPAPSQAFATAQVVNGFVVGVTVAAGGSGYVTAPAVKLVSPSGTNATAVATISGRVVTGIAITSAGIGYTNSVTVQVDPPPAASLSPTVQAVMRLDCGSLSPYDNYQIHFKPAMMADWQDWSGGFFSPTGMTSSQHLIITNGTGFFRLLYGGGGS